MTMKITIDTSGAAAVFERLERAARDSLARPAAQAAAQVMYDEVKLRTPISSKIRQYKGKTIRPGALRGAIYQVFSKDNSGAGVAEYHVSVNFKKAPHWHLVEFGHGGPRPAPAKSYLRSGFEASKGRAEEAMRKRFLDDLASITG
jgi:HK97 gp10 family phage protein